MIYMKIIFDINDNSMCPGTIKLINSIIGNIANIDTRMLYIYKSILKLTLKQI